MLISDCGGAPRGAQGVGDAYELANLTNNQDDISYWNDACDIGARIGSSACWQLCGTRTVRGRGRHGACRRRHIGRRAERHVLESGGGDANQRHAGRSHFTGILPRSVIDTSPATSPALLALGNSSVDIGKNALLGSMYAGYRYNPNFYFGLAFGTPFGLGTELSVPWPGQNLSLKAAAKSFEGNPIVGYTLNDAISVAVGLRVMWVKAEFTRALVPSAAAPNVASLDGTDVGVGWNAGVRSSRGRGPNWRWAIGRR